MGFESGICGDGEEGVLSGKCLFVSEYCVFLNDDFFGGMSEWSKEHAWKVCIPQKGIKGSNPFSSAIQTEKTNRRRCGLFE